MNVLKSLSHSRWDCKYHVVFVRKGRKKALYGKIREYLKPVFHELARQRGSEIVMHVRDDGKGIDADSVRNSIVNNNLLDESAAQALSDDEARSYIFYSGLSTSSKVTALKVPLSRKGFL